MKTYLPQSYAVPQVAVVDVLPVWVFDAFGLKQGENFPQCIKIAFEEVVFGCGVAVDLSLQFRDGDVDMWVAFVLGLRLFAGCLKHAPKYNANYSQIIMIN